LFISIGIVPPAEGDIAVLDLEDTVIADSYPVGISAKVLKDTLGAIERRFAIDNPLFMVELSSEHFKDTWVLKMTDAAREYADAYERYPPPQCPELSALKIPLKALIADMKVNGRGRRRPAPVLPQASRAVCDRMV